MTQKMTYIFDIDDTLCNYKEGVDKKDHLTSYLLKNLEPKMDIIKIINRLYKEGNRIIIMTGRGATTGLDWREETEKQLKIWNIKYHELLFIKKPLDYIYVDDKALSPKEFIKNYDK